MARVSSRTTAETIDQGKHSDAGEIKFVGMLAQPCAEALGEGRMEPDFLARSSRGPSASR